MVWCLWGVVVFLEGLGNMWVRKPVCVYWFSLLIHVCTFGWLVGWFMQCFFLLPPPPLCLLNRKKKKCLTTSVSTCHYLYMYVFQFYAWFRPVYWFKCTFSVTVRFPSKSISTAFERITSSSFARAYTDNFVSVVSPLSCRRASLSQSSFPFPRTSPERVASVL